MRSLPFALVPGRGDFTQATSNPWENRSGALAESSPRISNRTIVTRSLLACCMRLDTGCERLLREPTSRLRVTPESQEA